MRAFSDIEELRQAVGTHLGYSDWRTVSQQQIDRFADATGDHQWIHVDPDRAAAGSFGTTIAHGYLTLSLVPALVSQVYSVGGIKMGINYGADKVRFPTPVPVDSAVRAGVELLALEQNGDSYRATTRVTIERADAEKPACVADTVTLLVV